MSKTYTTASKTSRFLANTIDQFIVSILIITIIGIPLGIFYHFYRDSFKFLSYQSVGKKAVGIRLLDFSQKQSPYSTSIKRHWYTIIPLFAIIDGLYLIFNSKSKRLGDLIADTEVVEDFDGFVYNELDHSFFDINDKKNASKTFSHLIKTIKKSSMIFFNNFFKPKLISIYKSRLLRITIFITLGLCFIIAYIDYNKRSQRIERYNQEQSEKFERERKINFLKDNLLLFNDNIIYEKRNNSSVYKLNDNLLISFDFNDYDYRTWESGKKINFMSINFQTLNKTEKFINCNLNIKTIDGIILDSFTMKIDNLYATANEDIIFQADITDDFDKLIDIYIRTESEENIFNNLKPHFGHELNNDKYKSCSLCKAYYNKATKY